MFLRVEHALPVSHGLGDSVGFEDASVIHVGLPAQLHAFDENGSH